MICRLISSNLQQQQRLTVQVLLTNWNMTFSIVIQVVQHLI